MCFAVSVLCAAAASRRIGPGATLAWVMSIGLVPVVPAVALFADASRLSLATITLLVVAGLTNVLGLRIEYVALRRGKVGVIAPIVSTEGVVATLIAVLAGLHLRLRTGVLLGVVTVGVVLAAAHADPSDPGDRNVGVRSAVLALPVALLFGMSLYATGRVGRNTSVLWILLTTRMLAAALITAPLAGRRQLRSPGEAALLVATAGAAEVLGILSYTLGARHELAVAVVLTSQFAALAAAGAWLAFGERLSRSQLAGLVIVAIGVGLLAASGS